MSRIKIMNTVIGRHKQKNEINLLSISNAHNMYYSCIIVTDYLKVLKNVIVLKL